MAFAKETLCPVISELTFIRKTNTDDGNGIVLYFQSPEYFEEYGKELPVDFLLSDKSEDNLLNFNGNIKFTISKEKLDISVHQKLVRCESLKKYIVKYGISPQMMTTSMGGIKYAKTKPIAIYENWTEFFKELKTTGLISSGSSAAATAG